MNGDQTVNLSSWRSEPQQLITAHEEIANNGKINKRRTRHGRQMPYQMPTKSSQTTKTPTVEVHWKKQILKSEAQSSKHWKKELLQLIHNSSSDEKEAITQKSQEETQTVACPTETTAAFELQTEPQVQTPSTATKTQELQIELPNESKTAAMIKPHSKPIAIIKQSRLVVTKVCNNELQKKRKFSDDEISSEFKRIKLKDDEQDTKPRKSTKARKKLSKTRNDKDDVYNWFRHFCKKEKSKPDWKVTGFFIKKTVNESLEKQDDEDDINMIINKIGLLVL